MALAVKMAAIVATLTTGEEVMVRGRLVIVLVLSGEWEW